MYLNCRGDKDAQERFEMLMGKTTDNDNDKVTMKVQRRTTKVQQRTTKIMINTKRRKRKRSTNTKNNRQSNY